MCWGRQLQISTFSSGDRGSHGKVPALDSAGMTLCGTRAVPSHPGSGCPGSVSFDAGAHSAEEVRKVADLRFHQACVVQDRFAFRQRPRPSSGFRPGDCHGVHEDLRPVKPFSRSLHVPVHYIARCAHPFETHEVQVDRPGSNRAPPGQRNPGFLYLRPEAQNRRRSSSFLRAHRALRRSGCRRRAKRGCAVFTDLGLSSHFPATVCEW